MSTRYCFIKYRIYPNNTQKSDIRKIIGATRYVWNWALDYCTKAYNERGEHIDSFDLSNELTKLRNSEGMEWLKEINRMALSQTLRELHFAFQDFFHKKNRYPKFKDLNMIKKRADGYYRTEFNRTDGDKTHFNIEKLGMVRTKIHKPLPPKGKAAQRKVKIVCDIRGRYYAIVAFEVEQPPKREIRTKTGIDVGSNPLMTFSNGDKVFFPKNFFSKRYQKQLAHQQRILARKTSGSRNYEKQRIRVARKIEKEINRRNYFYKTLVKEVVEKYDEIHIETIPLKEMYKDNFHNVKKAMFKSSLFELTTQLERKAFLLGATVYKAERDFPSTQLCSNCGYRNREIKNPSIKKWDCPNCGKHHDRDVNAAINLLNHYPAYGMTK